MPFPVPGQAVSAPGELAETSATRLAKTGSEVAMLA